MIVYMDNATEFQSFLESLKGKVIGLTSGYFDPIHPGHVSMFNECHNKAPIDELIVLLNGDKQATLKKGKPFMPTKDRAYIISNFSAVDHVVIYDNPDTVTSVEPLDIIKPAYFLKGGDRDGIEKIPEWDVCQKNGTEIVTNVGDPKIWSSSNYLSEWVDFVNSSD